VKPCERSCIPLAQVKQADNPNQVQRLDRNKASAKSNHFMFECCGKCKNCRKQDNYRLDSITTTLNLNGKSIDFALNYFSIGDDVVIK